MAYIAWTDSDGDASLSNTLPTPGNRFTNWTPDAVPVGPIAVGLGTGLIYQFNFRNDLTVSLEIAAIPGSEYAKTLRLKLHLMGGGTVTVSSEHVLTSVFASSTLQPGTVPTIQMSDNVNLEYTFSVVLRSVSGTLPYVAPAGTSLWWKADDLLGTLNDLDPVATWPAAAGTTITGTQPTANKQGTFKLAQQNGLPGVQMYNTNVPDWIKSASDLPGTTQRAFFLVCKKTGSGAFPNNYPRFMEYYSYGIGGDGLILFTHDDDNTASVHGESADFFFAGADPFVCNLYTVIVTTSAAAQLYLNGVAVGSSFNPTNGVLNTGKLYLSIQANESEQMMDALYHEVLVIDGGITTPQLNVIHEYLLAKWNVGAGNSDTGVLSLTGFAPTITTA